MCKRIIVAAVFFMMLSEVLAEENLTALQILAEYSEVQNKLTSYIIKTEIETTSDVSLTGTDSLSGVRKKYEIGEIRFDGNRNYYRYQKWGDVGKRKVPADDPVVISFLFDGQQKLQCSLGKSQKIPALVVISKGEYLKNIDTQASIKMGEGQSLAGYFFGDKERIDFVLKDAESISVRENLENINGSNCHVIEATVKNRGSYILWLDPDHGYNIAKAVINKKSGDWAFKKDYVLMEKAKVFTSIDNVRFQKVNDVWVPVEADIVKHFTRPNGDYTEQKLHCKRTKVVLNPDHDALGSFLPTDVPNGALVQIVGVAGIRYIWRDGKLVPNVEEKRK